MDEVSECEDCTNFRIRCNDFVNESPKEGTMQPVLKQAEKIESWIQYAFDVVSKNENLVNIISSLVIIHQSEIVWRNGVLSFPGFLFAWPLANLFHSLNQQCCLRSLKLNFQFTLIFTFIILWSTTNSWLCCQELIYQKLQSLTIEGQLSQIGPYNSYYWILRLQLTTSASPTFYLTKQMAMGLTVSFSTLMALVAFLVLRFYRHYVIEPLYLNEMISKDALKMETDKCKGDYISNGQMQPVGTGDKRKSVKRYRFH